MVYSEKKAYMTKVHQQTVIDVTEDAKAALERSGIKNGLLTVYSQHTTCSVSIQEPSRGQTFNGTLYIFQDLIDTLEKIAPTCKYEGQYLHPSLEHRGRAEAIGEDAAWSLNTDAHIRSVIMGRSVTIPITDGKMELGRFGHVFFIDWDQVRARERECMFHVMGE